MDLQETGKPVKAKKAKILSNPAYRGTERKLRIFIEQYTRYGRVMKACEAAGIDHATHYRRMQSDTAYRAAVEEAEQAAAQRLEDRVYEIGLEGELPAALALLRRFRPQHYRERSSVEVTGSIDLVDQLAQARERMIPLDADTTDRQPC